MFGNEDKGERGFDNIPVPTESPLAEPIKSPGSDNTATEHHDLHHSEQLVEKGTDVEPPFSVYTTRQKWLIITVAGFAGLFSPLTANIYFPAIQNIADAFHTSVELINVTVTVYMILQGISPMLWGTLSDRLGRRPLFLVCLGLLTISCVGISLIPTDAYWLLVLLRCFQAAGSASTIALGSGTVTDIAEPSERGGFLGIFSLGALAGPCLGPIFGGLLTNSFGWRSIFWFLTITCGTYFLIFFLIFPETLRVVVGNGSIPPPPWNRPLLPLLTKYNFAPTSSRPPPKRFINPLLQFTHPSVALLLFFNGTLYACLYAVTASLSTLFSEAYPFLNERQLGLCFLGIGLGAALGSFMNGRLLDADFKRIQRNLERKAGSLEKGAGEATALHVEGKLDAKFPIEYARLRLVPVYLVLYVTSMAGYGWALQRRVNIACPLILQFLIGWSVINIMNTTQTLFMDLFHTQGSSITAANNLVRCTMGAVLVSIMNFILSSLRPGWTYTLLSLICVGVSPLVWVVVRFGPSWRRGRNKGV